MSSNPAIVQVTALGNTITSEASALPPTRIDIVTGIPLKFDIPNDVTAALRVLNAIASQDNHVDLLRLYETEQGILDNLLLDARKIPPLIAFNIVHFDAEILGVSQQILSEHGI